MNLRPLFSVVMVAGALFAAAQVPEGPVTLEQCRELALKNNKSLRMQSEKIKAAHYQNDEAFAAYLPGIDFAGGYMYNQRNISVFDSDQLLPVKNFDMSTQSYQFSVVKNPLTGEP
ncbi:MAG: TolC family protein, partial [Duncaniella sp.]|nr:TolC family protein [Duncaniella sp.]